VGTHVGKFRELKESG